MEARQKEEKMGKEIRKLKKRLKSYEETEESPKKAAASILGGKQTFKKQNTMEDIKTEDKKPEASK